jgi:hypothetical protein
MKVHPLKNNNKQLLCTSCLTSFSVYFSYKNDFHWTFFGSTCILLTSLNHWRKPEYSFRRKLDILTVTSTIVIQTIKFSKLKYFKQYLILLTTGFLFYPVANKVKNKKISAVCHSMIHILCNIATCLVLINGKKN